MLRFLQGVHKAFRSNQAYAPCQKAAHDTDEFDCKLPDISCQRRHVNTLSGLPLSQEPPKHVLTENGLVSGASAPLLSPRPASSRGNSEHGGRRFSLPTGILPGAVFGAGYAVLKSVHGCCSGRKHSLDHSKSKYCPVAQFQHLHQSGAVLQSITNLLPFTGYPATSTSFSVVPKANTRRAHGSKTEFKENGREKPVSDKNTTKIEFERAKEEVNRVAYTLLGVDRSSVAADHLLAMRAWNNNEYSTAVDLWHRTVDRFATGMAAIRLGMCYEQGLGVEQSYEQAAHYYELAASHSCPKAMYRLALLHINGHVKGGDGMKLMQQSADSSCAEAQVFLGCALFHQGDLKSAAEYYMKAADQECTDAYYYLGVCYETGAIDEQPDDVKAAHYYSLGAENGHPDAQYNLAVFYEEGYGNLDIDREKAVYWLSKSSKQGHALAKERLAELGCLNRLPGSTSLPVFNKHLASTLADLSLHDMPRARSDAAITKKRSYINLTPSLNVAQYLSRASSASSVAAGTPKFYVPTDSDDEDQSEFCEWSDEGLSSASSSSLQLGRPSDDGFSVEFAVENLSFDPTIPKVSPSLAHTTSWDSISSSGDSRVIFM